MNQDGSSQSDALIRRLRWGMVVLLVLLPPAVWGAREGLSRMTNHPLQWISNGAQSGRDFTWFSELFEHYDPLVIGWDESLPDDPRIEEMVAGLETHVEGGLFAAVTSTKEVWDALTQGPLELTEAEAFERLYPALIGEQGETLVIAILSKKATARTQEAIDVIYDVAEQRCGLSRNEVHLGGPTVESVAIDDASVESLYRNVIPSAIAVMLVASPCLRSVWLTLVIGALAGICEALTLSTVYYLGSPFTGLLVVMPALVFVVFLSGSVHFCNYFYDALDDCLARTTPGDSRESPALDARVFEDAPRLALRAGTFPCSLAAGTTAVGIYSLATSRIEPVQVFAAYAGSGVLIALLVMLTMLPGVLVLRARQMGRSASKKQGTSAPNRQRRSLIVSATTRAPWAVAALIAAGTLVCGWGIERLNPTMDQSDFFAEDSKMMSDMRWLEQHIGPLLPLEVAVRMKSDAPLPFGERMRWVGTVAAELETLEAIGGCLSAATFAPEINSGASMGEIVRRRTVLREIANQRDELLATPYIAMDGADEVWRISVRVAADADHDQVREEVGNVVERMMTSLAPGLVSTPPVYTGLLMLIADSRRRLFTDLVTSFSVALVVIAIALSVMFRSIVLGAASILPNVFPTLLVFGCMGWLGADMDVGAMITASVGLGIAVDDTVHYLTWFTDGLRQGLAPNEAAAHAHRRCAAAMFRTTLICGAGLIVFLFSPLVLAARFAGLICILLAAAIVGDLVFLPAILCGPLRHWSQRRAQAAREAG